MRLGPCMLIHVDYRYRNLTCCWFIDSKSVSFYKRCCWTYRCWWSKLRELDVGGSNRRRLRIITKLVSTLRSSIRVEFGSSSYQHRLDINIRIILKNVAGPLSLSIDSCNRFDRSEVSIGCVTFQRWMEMLRFILLLINVTMVNFFSLSIFSLDLSVVDISSSL